MRVLGVAVRIEGQIIRLGYVGFLGGGNLKLNQRQQQILSQLRAWQSELSVEELARKFAVSEITIRRGLEQLESDRAILRTHGSCVLTAPMHGSRISTPGTRPRA